MAYLSFDHVTKTYQSGAVPVTALRDVSFSVNEGEICVIVGASGAGKTTILNILGGMDSLTEGSVWLGGKNIAALSAHDLTSYRRYDVGFVFQFYNLISNLTALENVELATEIAENPDDPREILKAVGLEGRMDHFPSQLSGGEQQRVAIARALAKNPKLLLCDEPTGALDDETGAQILEELENCSRIGDRTVLIVTHNQAICPIADRVIRVRNGTVAEITENPHPTPAREIRW